MKSKVSIVTIDYNSHEATLDCLKSLSQIDKDNFSLSVVVVNNYPENPIKIDKKKFKNLSIELIYNNTNTGFTGGNNLGIKKALEAGADFVIILNNDTLVDKHFLNELILIARSDKKIGMVSPKIYFAKGYEFHKDRYKKDELGKVIWYAGGWIDWDNIFSKHRGVDEVDQGQYDKVEEIEFATGCCFLITREALKEVGDFDDSYFLYLEDSDLSHRIMTAGFKIIYNPKALIWHKNAVSAGGSGSPLHDYYITRNRLIFGMRYAPIKTRQALIRESIRLFVMGRKWQRKGVIDYYLKRLGKGSYGA